MLKHLLRFSSHVLWLISFVFVFTSCKKEPEVVATNNSVMVDFDAKLSDLLNEESNGEGLFYYMLPGETNYAQIPQDENNPLNSAKIQLGRMLFHETGIGLNPSIVESGEGTYSCSSCHHAWAGFQANLPQGIGEGGIGFGIAGEGRVYNPEYTIDSIDTQPLRSPTVINSAYQEVMLWNGSFGANGPNKGTEDLWGPGAPIFNNNFGHDGLESQAIGGLTVHRMEIDEQIVTDLGYKSLFDQAFPGWPQSTRYSARTAGLAVAAYERTLLSNQAPFQEWLKGDSGALTDHQKKGAILFFEKANCVACHSGPALNSMSFHALGFSDMTNTSNTFISNDIDEFQNANKGRGGFTQRQEDFYKFKTPQLYNLKDSPFYGHGGTYHSVQEIIEYKNNAVSDNPNVTEEQLSPLFVPLDLTDEEIQQLVDFIENGLYDSDLFRYSPDEVMSGNCIPNNDDISVIDQGCAQ